MTQTADGMIVTEGLVKKFGDFAALDHASIHVPRGSVYGLVGPNGAGKSTLLRNVMGIYRPDEGTVTIDGEPVWDNDAIKQRIAFIPDELFYFPTATLLDMRDLYRGLYRGFDEGLFERLGKAFVAIDPTRQIRHLSKGMQKQAIFWLSISCRPDVVLLDEPVDGLDPVMRRQVWSIILSDVAEHGTTVLVSSHNLRELEDVCDYVGIMHQGRILLERSLADLEGSVCKVQVAFAGDSLDSPDLPSDLTVLHREQQGHVCTLIVRGERDRIVALFTALRPLVLDVLPLTLEEVFVYEMGGSDYGIKDIVL